MCVGFNFLAVEKSDKPYFNQKNSGHSKLKEELNQPDNKLYGRHTVNIEVLPLGSLTSLRLEDWQFKVDEEGTLPAWFEEERDTWKTRCIEETLGIIKKIRKTGIFEGSLNLQGTQIKSLGSLKNVGGFLDLRYTTQIKSLGSLKNVGGFLYLRYTQIKSLGSLKNVGGFLYLRGTRVKKYARFKGRVIVN